MAGAMICSDCRHWGRHTVFVSNGHRRCDRIVRLAVSADPATAKIAFITPPGTAESALWTPADFGCTYFTPLRTRPANIAKPSLEVRHSELERSSEDSPYKSVCPACKTGQLLVYRLEGTLEIMNYDRCTLCGQHVIYLDETINGEKVWDARATL